MKCKNLSMTACDRASGRVGRVRRRARVLEIAILGRLAGVGIPPLSSQAVAADLAQTVAPVVCLEAYRRWRTRYERACALRASRRGRTDAEVSR